MASSMPLRIASGTSAALPSAEADGTLAVAYNNQRGELHHAAALNGLGYTVERYDVLGVLVLTLIVSVKSEPLFYLLPDLELQAALAGAICQLLHAAVVHIAAAVEYDVLNALSLAALSNELANLLGCFLVAAVTR